MARAARHLANRSRGESDPDAAQAELYVLAFMAAEAAAIRCIAEDEHLPDPVAAMAGSDLVRSTRARLDGRRISLGLAPDVLADPASTQLAAAGHDPALHAA
ncbi:MAG: hypothetical protein GWN79_11555, partial [Actinobacteria bacterium]|nr:hypothetical protein [Actinomycetota bacterium]NIS31995.1 hypothetical protein [Actinomycetota bacterium]NIT96006.1 hypothetical protein [Actinomycetota bacterium]NIU19683.1 hypothetical protein [Actinomycetota bacterium]NIU67071.1 hypothetical protein [Actinomycetota bacterium]